MLSIIEIKFLLFLLSFLTPYHNRILVIKKITMLLAATFFFKKKAAWTDHYQRGGGIATGPELPNV